MSNSNIDNLANKLRNITVGTPKTKSQRAAESAERIKGAKVVAAERASAERKGSWQSAMRKFYENRNSRTSHASHTGVKKAKSRRTLKRDGHKVHHKATARTQKMKSLRMKAAMNAAKTKREEATRKRRETAAMKKEANKAAASAAIITGRTRGQAKTLSRNSDMK
jgi:hypothetical protein